MHEDPTRLMGQPEDPRGPDGHRPHGNMRLVIACLIAVIVGLVIAVVVIAGDNGSDSESTPTAVTDPGSTMVEPGTTESTETTTTEPTTTESTETTTEETTTTEPTTTEEPEELEEEGGSGGLEAP